MRNATRLQVATAATAVFIGGTIAGGIALRDGGSANGSGQASTAPEVIHKRKVRTIEIPASQPGVTPATAVAATPVSAPAPAPVSSRTSPTGGAGGGGDDEREGVEVERGESD
jgi:hypothetical protein